jgi:bifunctional non-homologous end joining protein LigD
MVRLKVIEPMKATPGDLPTSDDDWAYEVKWDGMRIVAYLGDGPTRLLTTTKRDAATGFPELDDLAEATDGRPAILDGEVVAFADGRPSFSRLQDRMHISDRSAALERAADNPITFAVFDLLHFDGHESWKLPYTDRRQLLEDLVSDDDHWHVPSSTVGGGRALLDAVTEQGLEGLIAKRLDRPYEPGKRSSVWRKIKVRIHDEFVVGGWTEGAGNRAGHLGSLVLGCHDESGTLHWIGNVGTGFTHAELDRLRAKLASLEREEPPFVDRPRGPTIRGPHWVEPKMVVEVAYAEFTPDRHLRHPSYLGERTDKLAEDVVFPGV